MIKMATKRLVFTCRVDCLSIN